MKKGVKFFIYVVSAPFLLVALYISYLWATYIDDTITSGEKYGFVIGQNKKQTYVKVVESLKNYSKLKIHIVYGHRAGDMMTITPNTRNYQKLEGHNNWSLLLDGDGEFFNVIKLNFENQKLSEIYRHRKYFELP